MSIAILYTHPDFRASAMSARRQRVRHRVSARRRADAARDAYMLELRGVPTRVDAQAEHA